MFNHGFVIKGDKKMEIEKLREKVEDALRSANVFFDVKIFITDDYEVSTGSFKKRGRGKRKGYRSFIRYSYHAGDVEYYKSLDEALAGHEKWKKFMSLNPGIDEVQMPWKEGYGIMYIDEYVYSVWSKDEDWEPSLERGYICPFDDIEMEQLDDPNQGGWILCSKCRWAMKADKYLDWANERKRRYRETMHKLRNLEPVKFFEATLNRDLGEMRESSKAREELRIKIQNNLIVVCDERRGGEC